MFEPKKKNTFVFIPKNFTIIFIKKTSTMFENIAEH